jgi:hypothetical protein
MASAQHSDKPAALAPKSTRRSPSPQLPQIRPPLLIDGPESVRDSNC